MAPTCPPRSCLPPARPLAAPVVPPQHPCLAALLCVQQQPSCLLWPGHLEAETPCPVWRGLSQPGTKSLAAQQVASEGRAGPCAGGVDRVEARWQCRWGLRGAAGSLDGGQLTCRAGPGVNKWFTPEKRPCSLMLRCSWRSGHQREVRTPESACNVGDPGSILGLGRSPGGGHGNPLQYACLENPLDRGAYTAHGVAESQT